VKTSLSHTARLATFEISSTQSRRHRGFNSHSQTGGGARAPLERARSILLFLTLS